MFDDVPIDFIEMKLWLIDATGLAKDALHIYIGLTLFVIVRLVWRDRYGTIGAWLIVALAALAGEWLDREAEILRQGLRPDIDHWHDIWNTLFWPTVLAITLRWLVPRGAPAAPAGDDGAASGEDAERGLEQP